MSYSRFGVILSRKSEKKATRRNRMKRMIFNFVRLKKLNSDPGYDFLIIARPQAFTAEKKEIEAELNKFLNPNI